MISIHALLTESDELICQRVNTIGQISIHALLTESDRDLIDAGKMAKQFQSTLSSRRATFVSLAENFFRIFQSTLSSRRATLLRGHPLHGIHISIHALLTESDWFSLKWMTLFS